MRRVTKENLIVQIDRLHKIRDEQGRLSMYSEYTLQAFEMLLATMDAEPVMQPVMFIDGDISSDDADKLAKIIREFNEEDEGPLAKMARIIRENPHPTNECDMLNQK